MNAIVKSNLFLLAICLHLSLTATIIKISDLKEAEEEFLGLDNNALALFDVDLTLIIPDDAILRPCGQRLMRILVREILDNPAFVPFGKYTDDYLHAQVLLQSKTSLVDPQFQPLIKALQNKKIPAIALTAAPTGKVGSIESMADWRIAELKQFGIDFSSAFPDVHLLEFPKRAGKEFPPAYKAGVLFSSHHPKGDVLRQFLAAIQWIPSKVVFIDDRLDYLQSTESAMQVLGIPFTGFHYTAAERLHCPCDEEVAEFQFEYLAENGRWLSDDEARSLLEKCDNAVDLQINTL